MNPTIHKALELWGIIDAEVRLVAARENQVYRVTTPSRCLALRLHRNGYRTDSELSSELNWMAAVALGGISVPAPVPSASGETLHVIDGDQVDMLTWLSGQILADVFDTLQPPERARIFYRLGQMMAQFHDICDSWTPPDGFKRVAWDREGLLGEQPLWDRFWDNPTLSPSDKELFLSLRRAAIADLRAIEHTLDYGLIHADLVGNNIMLDGGEIRFIDFDDGGYGFRLFDIATALLKFSDDPDFPALRSALIEGYGSTRTLDVAALDLFMLLRSATYVGWIIQRMDEDQADARNARFIAKTRRLAQAYLAGHRDTIPAADL